MTDSSHTTGNAVRLAAVGDLLLAAPPSGDSPPLADRLAAVRPLWSGCDIIFGNLECTLPGDGRTVPAEPRVVATEDAVRAVAAAGFTVVTLANNHTFDCLDGGFRQLRRLLDELGVRWFGAGDNLAEASAPAVIETGGLRVAMLGAADERSGPSQFAAADHPGIAPLDVDRLEQQVRDLRSQVDLVVLSLHWGEERFLLPSPVQIDQARRLAAAGAGLILGHHPHVLQGMETAAGVPVIYSMGNFVANDVYYTDGDVLRWNRTERTGCVLTADLAAAGATNVRTTPTHDDGRRTVIDETGLGAQRIARSSRAIARGISLARYRRHHLWIKTLRPALDHLRWSQLKRVRWSTLRNALAGLLRARKAR